MPSNNTRAKTRAAITPQRRHGKARVAALLAAAAAVVAERGYDAATMAEIAARAKAPIGSLYRFFPNKEILAGALIQRYVALVGQVFDRIDRLAASRPDAGIADAILDYPVSLHGESKAILALLEGRADWPSKRLEFREFVLGRLARTVLLCAPALSPAAARDVSVVLFHNLKLMKAFKFKPDVTSSPGAANELRQMTRLYFASKLPRKQLPAGVWSP